MNCDKETVWLRTSRGNASFGTSKHLRSDVEAAIAENRIAIADRSLSAGSPGQSPAPPTSGGVTTSTAGRGGFWAGLPKWGKVGLAAVPALLLLLLIPGGCGHSDSWRYGYNQGREYGAELLPLGISKESVCRSAARDGGSRVNTEEAYKGCLAGLKDRG